MFELPELPYAYEALEPFIDARTMEIHHSKHHQAYVDNLNKALEKRPEFSGKSLEELLRNLASLPEGIRTAVRNHAGGHFNHSLFWQIMGPQKGGEPTGELLGTITKEFGSFAGFKETFSKAALAQFGSGWAWLSAGPEGKLIIGASPNQDSPLSQGLKPVLGVDVWEHAYYLKYQNKRADYIEAWWQVVNWEAVSGKYKAG